VQESVVEQIKMSSPALAPLYSGVSQETQSAGRHRAVLKPGPLKQGARNLTSRPRRSVGVSAQMATCVSTGGRMKPVSVHFLV
jgi:hypothetical protein